VTRFRIGHATDLHFGLEPNRFNGLDGSAKKSWEALKLLFKTRDILNVAYPSTFDLDVARVLLQRLHSEQVNLDALIITGDLATTGEHVDLDLAKNYFHGSFPGGWNFPAIDLPTLLGHAENLVLTLPGNHDRYEGITLGPYSRKFEEYFGKNWDFDRGHAFAFPSTSLRVRASLLKKEKAFFGICLADFSLVSRSSGSGLSGYAGQGKAIDCVVQELAAATEALELAAHTSGGDFGCIWAMHFPPNFPAVSPSLELLAPEKIIEAAQRCGVKFVIAGHTHEALMYATSKTADAITVICGGASAGISDHENYSFGLLDIDVLQGGGLLCEPHHFLWDEAVGDFLEQPVYPSKLMV
jgi:hypothetical protein